MDYSNGFGDYLRGSIILAQYAKYYNINFKMDMSKHYISEYLEAKSEVLLVEKIDFFFLLMKIKLILNFIQELNSL